MGGTPTNGVDSGGPIEFLLPGSGDAYLDFANTYLLVQAKVTKADGSNLDTDDPVGPVNDWLHSLFSQADVYLNDTLVTPSTNTYPFRAYIETALSYGTEAKEMQLTSQLWDKDTAGRMDSDDANIDAANADLVLQDRFLLKRVDVKIRLVRSKDACALMAGGVNTNYKVHIVDASVFARRVRPYRWPT